ncbi:MAG: hypothetical protein DLM73_09865 [Chthoniobacterales bacterium]|nr:MAG: hypothetical protein DLM73_09865 [Chthoniobacterales bacterium]
MQKSSLRVVPIYVLAALLLQACPPNVDHKKPSTVGGNDAIPLKSVLAVVNEAVSKAEKVQQAKGSPLRLKSASFTFKTVSTIEGGGELGVLVINASVSISNQTTDSVTYSYEKPKTSLLALTTNAEAGKLATAIDKKLNAAVPDFHNIPLNEIKVGVDFGVERKVGANAKIPVWSITIGPKVAASKNAVQSISLVFGK